MSFEYDDVGSFGSRRAAEDWAKRNNIDPRDLHIREGNGSCDVGVRRSAIPGGGFNDSGNRRRDGFF